MQEEILSFFPNKKIYGPIALLFATCIGGPLAAGYVVTRNGNAFGKKENKTRIWILSMLAVLGCIFLAIIFPPNRHFPWYLPVLNVLAACWALMQLGTKEYFYHRDNGGQLFSAWQGIAVGISSLVITVVILILGIMLHDLF
ncbi:MAG: hypothetical protein ACHQEM_11835 [Chitinophagales bacterium]